MWAHTPGPWERNTRPDSAGDDRPVIVVGHDLVCAVSRRDGRGAEADANARLISAAPELLIALEALRTVTAALADRLDEEMDLGPNDKPNLAMRIGMSFDGSVGVALNAADAAITKARGGGK